MQTFTTKTIREIAIAAPETTRVFEELKIDYCCGGRKPFTDACIDAGLDPAVVAEKISAEMIRSAAEPAANEIASLSAAELVDHIISTHHVFTAQEIERLDLLMEKVYGRHGEAHPELSELRDLFRELCVSLLPHMRKEELVLFPYIHALEACRKGQQSFSLPHFGTVNNPIRMMMDDHDVDGERLRKMREVTSDYVLPEGACPSYGALYAGLKDLEADLHRHIHLENNVLFPAASELERTLLEQVN